VAFSLFSVDLFPGPKKPDTVRSQGHDNMTDRTPATRTAYHVAVRELAAARKQRNPRAPRSRVSDLVARVDAARAALLSL
jgi:hypothetical protein